MKVPFFVSEVSSNHLCDLDRCYKFIESSAKIGCDAVKFQLFKIDELFAPEILAKSPEHRARKKWELPESFIPEISKMCKEVGIAFSCTPFYMDAVALLAPYVEFYKIASYELLWTDLLEACAATGKPVVLSTGMATMDEIAGAVSTLQSAGCKELTLLHCVSGYPAPAAQANLAAMNRLRNEFCCRVGWSDHTVQEGVIQRAVHKFDADMIEFHLDLDETGAEFSAGHCWLPEEMERVIKSVRTGMICDGHGDKVPADVELSDREWRADPEDGLRPLRYIRNS